MNRNHFYPKRNGRHRGRKAHEYQEHNHIMTFNTYDRLKNQSPSNRTEDLHNGTEESLSSSFDRVLDLHISDSEGSDSEDTNSLSYFPNSHQKQYDSDSNKRMCQKFVNSILQLPDDVLYIILSYLNQTDLCRLSLVCNRLFHICSNDTVWLPHLRRTILHNGMPFRRQCPNKELCRLAVNWETGRYFYSFKANHRIKLIPWLQKVEDVVWFSSGNIIRYFQNDPVHGWREKKKKSLYGMAKDATRFSIKHDMLVSGCRDGSVHLWTTSSELLHVSCPIAHQSEVLCVDLTDQALVSGSKDGICKIKRIDSLMNYNNGSDMTIRSFNAGDKVWSLKVSPCEGFFIAGLAGYLTTSPLVMWDIETGHFLGSLGLHHKHGAGVLDIKFESQHEVLTCGYDTFLRLWDLRTQKCVAEWAEPYDYTLYSVASDGGNAISVGTSRHGMVRLWDKRSTNHIQCYYSHHTNSPVYSLAMDFNKLFLAVDMGFSTMDFSIKK